MKCVMNLITWRYEPIISWLRKGVLLEHTYIHSRRPPLDHSRERPHVSRDPVSLAPRVTHSVWGARPGGRGNLRNRNRNRKLTSVKATVIVELPDRHRFFRAILYNSTLSRTGLRHTSRHAGHRSAVYPHYPMRCLDGLPGLISDQCACSAA